jgi:hypothetical protein
MTLKRSFFFSGTSFESYAVRSRGRAEFSGSDDHGGAEPAGEPCGCGGAKVNLQGLVGLLPYYNPAFLAMAERGAPQTI